MSTTTSSSAVGEELVVGEVRRVELTGLALRDSIPAFLDELADWLETEAPPGGQKLAAQSLKHVVDRLNQGFDLGQVFREYRLLREAILRCVLEAEQAEQDRAAAQGAPARKKRILELARLNAGLDVAMSGSVEEFVAERDRRAAVERASAEQALGEKEARYRAVLDSMGEAFGLMDRDLRIITQNQAALRLDGRPLEAIVGRTHAEVYPDASPELVALYERALSDGVPVSLEHCYALQGATPRWLEMRAFPVTEGLAVFWRDISDRKAAEAALRASEAQERHLNELFIAAVEASPVVLFTQDRELRYTWIPQPAPGYRPEDVIGKTDYEVLERREDADAFVALKRRALDTGQAVRDVLPATQQGVTRWYDIHVRPQHGSEGDVVGVLVAAVDVTEHKVVEEALRESEQRQAFLLELSDALRPLSDPAAIQGEAARLLREHFDVGWCYYAEFDEGGTEAVVLRDATRPGLPSLVGRHDLTEIPEYVAFFRTGQLLDAPDYANHALFSGRIAEKYTAIGVRAVLASALVKEGRLVAQLLMADTSPRPWPKEAVDLIAEVAERTWAALERARAEAELSRMRRRAEAVNAFRVRFSDAVEGLTDPQAVAKTACRMIREQLGTERAYWAEIDWTAREWVVGAAYDGSEASVIEGRFPLDAWEPFTSEHLAGRPVVVDDTQRDPRIPSAMREDYARLGVGADLGTAVTTGGKAHAALVVNQRLPRRWTAEETALLQDVAARCWAAVERARAETALRQSENRRAFLLKLSDALRPVAEADAVEATACRLIADHLDVERAYYTELDERNGAAIIAKDYAREGVPSIARHHRTADHGWIMPRLRRGETVVVSDVKSDPRIPDADRAAMAALPIEAHVSVPVVKGGALVGSFSVATMSPRRWSGGDIELVKETGERVWAAVERARAEKALRESEAHLRESDKRKSEFLAVLSHELRNPLAPIRNSMFLMERAPADSEQVRRAHEVIRRQTEHLTRLVDDLLDMTRISRGKVELHRERVDLRDVTRKATEDVRASFEKAGIELSFEIDTGPVWVEADPARIAQVIGNLLHNALKFTPAGGVVAAHLEVQGDVVQLRVRDTGAGMEPGREASMFEPFVQGEQGMARTMGGLGLGLSLVKSLVELHGGSVAAHSEGRDRGTEFIVSLPLASTGGTARSNGGGVKVRSRDILLIEDNEDAAQTLADVLALDGHHVRIAKDGRSGLAVARERRPEVIICDIGLPDVDGYEVARLARADPGLAGVRLVALTGYAQPEDRQRARDAGFDAHLAKPPDPEALTRVLGSDA